MGVEDMSVEDLLKAGFQRQGLEISMQGVFDEYAAGVDALKSNDLWEQLTTGDGFVYESRIIARLIAEIDPTIF